MITGRDAERLAYLGRSKQRIATARLRKHKQMRWLWLAVAAVGGVAAARLWVSGSAPEPPGLVVRWVQADVSQRLASTANVRLQRGGSFLVSLTEPEAWEVSAESDPPTALGEGKDGRRWSPSGESATLLLRPRARVEGVNRVRSWFWTKPEMKLTAVAPQSVGDFRFEVTPPQGGMWLAPYVYAKVPVSWDERALVLLSEPLRPALAGRLELSSSATLPAAPAAVAAAALPGPSRSPGPDQPLWWVVPSFAADAKTPAAEGDAGTYAKLNSNQPERDMARVAALIARAQPDASLRYIVRLDAKPPHGILRIAMDGKGDRKAWIKRVGEASGGPVIWPETSTDPVLEPRLPRS
jgi:hypothetical protein